MSQGLAREWRDFLVALEKEYVPAKNAQRVPMELSSAYAALTPAKRDDLGPLLREWILSDVSRERWAAIAIVWENDVTSMIPTVRELQARLEDSTEVRAVDDWETVNRLLGHLVSVEAAASDLTSESEP